MMMIYRWKKYIYLDYRILKIYKIIYILKISI